MSLPPWPRNVLRLVQALVSPVCAPFCCMWQSWPPTAMALLPTAQREVVLQGDSNSVAHYLSLRDSVDDVADPNVRYFTTSDLVVERAHDAPVRALLDRVGDRRGGDGGVGVTERGEAGLDVGAPEPVEPEPTASAVAPAKPARTRP